jgi:hypothetical protein
MSGEDGARIVTGDNGHKLLIWEDYTLEENARDTLANQTKIMQLHQVDTLLNEKKFEAAIKKAFELGLVRGLIKSFEAFLCHYSYVTESIFSALDREEELMDEEMLKSRELEADSIIQRCVEYFLTTDPTRFLIFVRDINTKNRYSQISSRLLSSLMRIYDLSRVPELNDKLANSESKPKLEDILGIINAYSIRHFDRLREFQQKASFMEYLVARVGYLSQRSASGDQSALPNGHH